MSKPGMYRKAADLIEALESADKYYFITAENGKIFISEDNETWSEKLQIWGDE